MKSENRTKKINPSLLNKEVMVNFPKVELHRHLEGTFSISTLHQIALKNQLKVPSNIDEFKTESQFPKDSEPNFQAFLSKFKNDWYRSFDDVYDITYNSIKEFTADGIYYIEVRFSPEHFADHNQFDRKEITKLIIDAGNTAAKEENFQIKYLITYNRSKQTEEQMIDLYKTIRSLELEDIVGMDLAGDETQFPPELFKNLFKMVHDDKLYKATIHAGEVSPPQQIWDAIDALDADRIGHGTSAIEDEKLQSFLTEKGIALEQCITSNYQTGSWRDEENHPIGRLLRADVPVTINSDDPFIQDTDLTDDYIKAVQYFDFNADDLFQLNLNACKSAFLPKKETKALIDSYTKAFNSFKKKFDL